MSTKNKIYGLTVIALVIGMVLLAIPQGSVQAASLEEKGGPGGQGGNGWGTEKSGNGTALTPLSEAEITALQDAILEEYGALNLYQAVIAQFGDSYPFSQIAASEQQHANALIRQAVKYGVAVPENPGINSTATFESLAEACQAGVDAEIADAALYDELMLVTDHADLIQVFTRLQNALLESHLPAFEACN